jgi:MFS family permease
MKYLLGDFTKEVRARRGRFVTLRTQRIAVSGIFAVHGAVMGTFSTRIPAIAEHLHLSPGLLGAALFAPSVGSLSLMPFTGRLIHRLGGKAATHVLLGAWCVALVLPAFAPNLAALCVALFVFGASAGMADIAMNAEGVALDQRMGKSVMSSLHGMWSVGGFAAAGIGALAAHRDVGVHTHFAAMAIVLFVLGQFACRLLPPVPAAQPASAPVADAQTPRAPRFGFPTGAVLVIALVAFCAVFAEVAGSDWCAVYLRDVLGAGHATAALGYGIFAFAMALCRLTGDRVVRRLGAATTVRFSAACGAVGGVLIVAAINDPVTMFGFGLMGVGIAVVVPLGFAAAGRIANHRTSGVEGQDGGEGAGARTGNAIAGVATIAYGAGLAAPGAIGGIATLTSLRVSFILVTVLIAVVALAAGALRNRDGDDASSSDAVQPLAATPSGAEAVAAG